MSRIYPILRSLDPHQQRIGYLGALASVATRGLESVEALLTRYHDLLFEKIYEDDERFGRLLLRVSDKRKIKLLERMNRSVEEEPSAILRGPEEKSNWLYVSEFWLFDDCMPSPMGILSKNNIQKTVFLARWTGLLQPTHELSEIGYILQYLLKEISELQSGQPCPNLLHARARPGLLPLYFRVLLSSEVLFPYLIYEFVDRFENEKSLATQGEHGLLRATVERLIGEIGEPEDPEDFLAFREITDFRESILKSDSTAANYLRPRMEILMDLGVVGRKGDGEGKQSDFVWVVNDATRVLARSWKENMTGNGGIEEYLDQKFFLSLSAVYGAGFRRVEGLEAKLYWFGKALSKIGRDFGFTPGRTAALMACLLAWEEGRILEVSEVFDAVYEAARTDWSKHFHFSGGSRFDREFLMRVDEAFLPKIEDSLNNSKDSDGGIE